MTTATVKKTADGFYVKLKSPNVEDFNNAIGTLKSYIHASARSYDPQARQWLVDVDAGVEFGRWLAYLRTVLAAKIEWSKEGSSSQHAGGGQRQQQQWPPRGYRQQPTREELYSRLFLLPSAPPEVVKAAYRELAKLNHPDCGGDHAAMQKINEAYAALAA